MPMPQNNNHWFVLVTKPRNEQKVESRLNDIGIQAYCPVRTELRQWSDRKKKIKVPLLPSMLLVKLPNNLRQRTCECFNEDGDPNPSDLFANFSA